MMGTKCANSAARHAGEERGDRRTRGPCSAVVLTPIASAATSSSRIGHSERPCGLFAMRRATSTTTKTQSQTIAKLERCGMPESPSARPNDGGVLRR